MSQLVPLLQCLTKYELGLRFHLQAQLGKDPLPSSSGGRTQFLVAVGWRLPSVPCHVDSSGGQLTTQQLASPKPARESVPQQDRLIILCNTIQKWHPAIFALYSIIQKQVIFPATLEGKELHTCMNTRSVDHWGHLRSVLLKSPFQVAKAREIQASKVNNRKHL